MPQTQAVSREDALESLLKAYIDKGEVSRVKTVLELRGRALSQQEADLFTGVCLKRHVDTALEAVGLGASQEAKERVVRECVSGKGSLCYAKKAVEKAGREFSTEELNCLLKTSLEKSYIDEAIEIANLLGRELSAEEIQALRKVSIENGYVNVAERAAGLMGEKLTVEEIDILVRGLIEGKRFIEAVSAAERGASPEVIELLIGTCIKERDFELAKKAVKLRKGKEFTTTEIDQIVQKLINDGRLDKAKKIVKADPRPSSTALNLLINALMDRLDFHDALEIARVADSLEAVNAILKRLIEAGWLECAMEAVKLRGTELTAEEISRLTNAIKSH